MTICFLKGEGPNVQLYPPRALLGYKVLLPSFSTAHYFITLCVNQQISTILIFSIKNAQVPVLYSISSAYYFQLSGTQQD